MRKRYIASRMAIEKMARRLGCTREDFDLSFIEHLKNKNAPPERRGGMVEYGPLKGKTTWRALNYLLVGGFIPGYSTKTYFGQIQDKLIEAGKLQKPEKVKKRRGSAVPQFQRISAPTGNKTAAKPKPELEPEKIDLPQRKTTHKSPTVEKGLRRIAELRAARAKSGSSPNTSPHP